MHPEKQYNQICDPLNNISRSLKTDQSWLVSFFFTCTTFLRVSSFQSFVRCSFCARLWFSLHQFHAIFFFFFNKKGLNLRLTFYISVSKEQRDPWFLPRRGGGCREAAEKSGCNLWHAAETCQNAAFMDLRGPFGGCRVSSGAKGLHTCKVT